MARFDPNANGGSYNGVPIQGKWIDDPVTDPALYWSKGHVNPAMSDRMNKLKTYMDIYDKTKDAWSGSHQKLGDFVNPFGTLNPMEWAEKQIANEGRGAEPAPGQFYNQQPQAPQQQYTQPQMQQYQNPYSGQQNNGPSEVTNYLRKLMEQRGGMSGGTQGFRG